MGYAKRDALHIASLEMQARNKTQATPVTSIKRLSVKNIQGGGDRLPVLFGQDNDQVVGHVSVQCLKKGQVQVGGITVFQVGLAIAPVEECQRVVINLAALQPSEPHTCLVRLLAILLQFFPFLLAQAAQDVLHVGVALIVPVKLNVVSEQEASFGLCGLFNISSEARR